MKWDQFTALELQTPLCCIINQTGWYRITHKAQVIALTDNITRVHSKVNYYYLEEDGRLTNTPNSIAVFDWECNKAVT